MSSFADCTLTSDQYSTGIASQIPQLTLVAVKEMVQRSPWANVYPGGTFPNFQGDTLRTLVTNRISTGQSLVKPAFVNTSTVCGTKGALAEYGQTQYDSTIQTLRGEGPLICLNQARYQVEDSYAQAVPALAREIVKVNNADMRWNALVRSGVKMVAASGQCLGNLVTGAERAISTNFAALTPNATLSFKALQALRDFADDTLHLEKFGSGADEHYIGLFSRSQIEIFRNELNVNGDARALAAGSYKIGHDMVAGYAFIDINYRGFKFGIDPQPLRAVALDDPSETDVPVPGIAGLYFVEPEIEQETDQGKGLIANPAWINAPYEVGFMVSKTHFKRHVPEKYVGDGSVKFPAQFAAGELDWLALRDNNCNKYLDFGQHLYQITRLYQPVKPHGIIPVIYTRCQADLGLAACANSCLSV
jgi:hypothetical protein